MENIRRLSSWETSTPNIKDGTIGRYRTPQAKRPAKCLMTSARLSAFRHRPDTQPTVKRVLSLTCLSPVCHEFQKEKRKYNAQLHDRLAKHDTIGSHTWWKKVKCSSLFPTWSTMEHRPKPMPRKLKSWHNCFLKNARTLRLSTLDARFHSQTTTQLLSFPTSASKQY